MMSSDDHIKAEMILDDILKVINELYMHKKINQPIEKAALKYTFLHPADVSYKSFNDTIQDFVTHLFNKGHAIKISSKSIAIAEAVAIVEMGYRGSSNGYYAAFLDSINPEINGFEVIRQQITEIIISILRAKHVQWVYDSNLTPLRWSTKTIIAQILLDRWKTYLPLNMQGISPAQMADHIPLLIDFIQKSEEKYRKSMGRRNT